MDEPITPESGVFRVPRAGWYQVAWGMPGTAGARLELRLISTDDEPRDDVTTMVQEQMRMDTDAAMDVRLTADSPEPESTPGDLWIDERDTSDFLVRVASGWTWVQTHTETLWGDDKGIPWDDIMGRARRGVTVRRPTEQEKAYYFGKQR